MTARQFDYGDALAAIQARGRFGIRLGLGRIRALLALLDHPEREFRGALIAGTNGKGSVAALTGSALRAAGFRLGEMPKPHLVTYRERIQVDGRPIEPGDFSRAAARVLALADRVATRHGDPTEFELLTAMAFRAFADAGVDLAVVEVGLGGRLDATHAWDGGVATVTNVELDHVDRLGPTIEAIAREKAAIIMRGDRAVTGAWGPALEIVRWRSRRMSAPLTVVEPAPLISLDRDGIEVELPGMHGVLVGLRGRHQAANVAVADATLDALAAAGIATVGPAHRRAGYAAARWPGRLELLKVAGRSVLLDGAHNPAGAATLAVALDDLRGFLEPGRCTLVSAIMSDKDVDGLLRALASSPHLAGARVIATSVGGERAMSPAELAARWMAVTGMTAETAVGPAEALEAGLGRRSSGAPGGAGRSRTGRRGAQVAPNPDLAPGPVIVAGSLYLVGAIRALLVHDPGLEPDPA